MMKFTQSSENINSNGGFSLVSRLLDRNEGMSLWDKYLPSRHNSSYSTSVIVRSAIGMMAAGYSNFSDVEKLHSDSLFKMVTGGGCVSQETLRQRLDALAGRKWQDVLDSCVASQLRMAMLTRVDVLGRKLVPLDIDVSVLEDTASHKEGVAMSYHKVSGYAPIFAYAGREGYMVCNELRPGSQHSERGAVDFLKRCVGIMECAGYKAGELLVRVDSGHDSSDFIRALQELGVKFIVKRNPRGEVPEQMLDCIRPDATREKPRRGKTVYRCVRGDRKPAGFDGFIGFMAVEAVERTILAKEPGQLLLVPEVEVDSWWTNLPVAVPECVALYHAHGTSEQFHSELKSDMGVELMPSGTFRTNTLFLGLAAIAFNCLRFIGQTAWAKSPRRTKKEQERRRFRLRTVILDFIKVGCKLVRHANCLMLKFGKWCPAFHILKEVYALC